MKNKKKEKKEKRKRKRRKRDGGEGRGVKRKRGGKGRGEGNGGKRRETGEGRGWDRREGTLNVCRLANEYKAKPLQMLNFTPPLPFFLYSLLSFHFLSNQFYKLQMIH